MKQNKKIIAVTGIIGSGKSTVLSVLQSIGEYTLSCDEINRELLYNEEYLKGLEILFPKAFTSGKLDKSAIRNVIFHNEEEREKLNSYAHKKIKEKLIEEIEKSPSSRVFVEIPLLNQVDFVDLFDEIWVIKATENVRIDRIIKRDNISKEEAISKIKTQNELFDFKQKTIYIYNDTNTQNLAKEIRELIKK